MAPEHHMRQQMLATIPQLRAFAISLAGNLDRADDLVQGTLLAGLDNLDKFKPGSNMRAWLFTILRNQFLTDYRKRKREIEDPEDRRANRVHVMPEQESRLDFTDMLTALGKLPVEQREALLLVAAEGLAYDEAAQICGTNLGTIKSRVNRARMRLSRLLAIKPNEELGPDCLVRAVLFAPPL